MIDDLLAYLAEQMLEMNERKQVEIRGFLGWLVGEVGAKVEDLSPKTKIQEYYKLKFDEFLTILKKNKRELVNYDPARREPQERLRSDFTASVGKLAPLMERIASRKAAEKIEIRPAMPPSFTTWMSGRISDMWPRRTSSPAEIETSPGFLPTLRIP